jgi:transposase-like protein
MARRKRRKFTAQFKADAVRLVTTGTKTIAAVTEQFDLTETALRAWVKRAEADEGKGTGETLTTAERSELIDLRKRLKRAEMERDILKKATADSMGRCNGSTLYDLMEGITSGKSEAWFEHRAEI